MNKNSYNSALPRLSDLLRPSISINKEIVSATNAAQLGSLFDASFNARIGVLSKDQKELERLNGIAEQLLQIIPKEKLNFASFIIVDNEMDLRNEVFADSCKNKITITEEQRNAFHQSALLFLQQVIQKSCLKYASFKNKDWNKSELRNELEKLKDHVNRAILSDEPEVKPTNKPAKQLLFSKKKEAETEHEIVGNLKNTKDSDEKDDRGKLLFTAPRARADSLPSDLIKTVLEGNHPKSYSFLDLLAADGYETKDLETFEEQVILKLDKLKEHILHQFNPVFNELNTVRKRLRVLAEQSNIVKPDRKSIMRE